MTAATLTPLAAPNSVYVPQPARVLEVRKVTEQEKLFRLALADGRPLDHQPGQFVQVSVMGVGECPISLCSSPTRRDSFELCVRRAGDVTGHLHSLRGGETVGIRGPYGHGFDMHEFHGRDVLIIAGGLGLAPLRSLIQYILDERARFGRFYLLYGARTRHELLFWEDLTAWRSRDDFNVQVTVDKPDESWRGKSGVVTLLFRDVPKLDPEQTVAVIVGPPVMFRHVVVEVLARRITQKNIFCSLERRMKCGIGRCGHCQANNVYVCLEGPVFKYAQLKALREAVE